MSLKCTLCGKFVGENYVVESVRDAIHPTQRITGTYALNAQKEGTNEDHTCNTARLTQV